MVKFITAGSHWEDDRIFSFISCLRSNLKCFWQTFLLTRNWDNWIHNGAVSKRFTFKRIFVKRFLQCAYNKTLCPLLDFFVSSRVIMSHLLSLLNRPWAAKSSSTLFMSNRFPFSSRQILASCFGSLFVLAFF